MHDPQIALGRMFQSANRTIEPDKIDLAYREYFKNKSVRTFDDELKLAEELYQAGLKSPDDE